MLVVAIIQFYESFEKLFNAVTPKKAEAAVSDVAIATKKLSEAIEKLSNNGAIGYDKQSLIEKK